jgi:D-arabinose 5-phosphate isomerase GutQ
MTESLRAHTNAELLALAGELQERAEQFDAKTRMLINDELRRRKLPVVGAGKSRH